MNYKVFKSLGLCFLIFGIGWGAYWLHAGLEDRKLPQLYWMPYCPYGIEAVTKWLELEKSDKTAIKELYYIAFDRQPKSSKAYNVTGSNLSQTEGCSSALNIPSDPSVLARGRFYSLHGSLEVEEGIRQITIAKKWPEFWRRYMLRFLSNPNESWDERCNAIGLNSNDVQKLSQSKIAEQWYVENISRAQKNNILISPSLVFGGNRLVKFPNTIEDLKTLLCSAGVLNGNCSGILCSAESPCLEKQGYIAECIQGVCQYKIAPPRADAVTAYLITPEDCVPAEVFPVEEAVKGWMSYFKITRLPLSDEKAQALLKEVHITAFPVLVVGPEITNREWGKECIKQLNLAYKQQHYYVTFEWQDRPFQFYSRIRSDSSGIHVLTNYYIGALILHRMGKLQEAAKSYRLALVDNPKDYRSWNNLGAILYDQGFKQAGGAMFEKAVGINDTYESALVNLARFYTESNKTEKLLFVKDRLGWLAVENKKWPEARSYFKDTMGDKKLEFSARKGLAYIDVQQGNPQEALDQMQKCLLINDKPESDFSNLLAGVYYRLGNYDLAIKWYLKALEDEKYQAAVHPNLCLLLSQTKRWEALRVVARDAWKTNKSNSQFGFYQASALAELNQDADAIGVLKEVLTSTPDAQFRASYELALLYGKDNNRLAFTKHANIFLKIISAQRMPQLHNECVKLVDLSMYFKDYPLAVRLLQQTLRIKPSDVEAHKQLAACYDALHEPDKKKEHLLLARQFGGDL